MLFIHLVCHKGFVKDKVNVLFCYFQIAPILTSNLRNHPFKSSLVFHPLSPITAVASIAFLLFYFFIKEKNIEYKVEITLWGVCCEARVEWKQNRRQASASKGEALLLN